MSIFDKDLISGLDKVQTAKERIRMHCRGKRTLVAFSGGKDSQCCYHLAQEAGIDFTAQYSVTRFEPPELIKFIREQYPDVKFRRAYNRSLVEQIRVQGLPNRWFRWCCDAKHKKTEGFDIAVVGIRWDESARRRMRWDAFGYKKDKTAYCCPIVDWTDDDVWEYLNARNITHCSLYDEGFTRIGCVCCPLATGKMKREAKRWPKTAAMLRLAHRLNWEYQKKRGFTTAKGKRYRFADYTPDESFDYWLEHGSLIMREDEPADEPCLFAGTGFSEGDGSDVQQNFREVANERVHPQ